MLHVSLKYLHVLSLSEQKETCVAIPKGKEENPFNYYTTFDYCQGTVIQQLKKQIKFVFNVMSYQLCQL